MTTVIWLEAAFAAGTFLGTAIGWWAARSSAESESAEIILTAVAVLEDVLKGKRND